MTRSTPRRVAVAALVVALAASLATIRAAPRGAVGLPRALADRDFWQLSETLSEPDGEFRFDNFLSNERGYQRVIPELLQRLVPGQGVYMGVGPEQNFTYMAALRPQMAFIVDVRRGNLQEHLLYKALIEMSATRAGFLSRLFSRERPAGLSDASTAADLFAAYQAVPSSPALYRDNLAAVIDWLTRRHGFPLDAADLRGIEYVYHDGFFLHGPDLDYSAGRGGRGGNAPTYRELMLATDEAGVERSYLATEGRFDFIKRLEAENLIVPVVGNFAGPKAIRAVGEYVRAHGGTVSAFYLSNVERYLLQDGLWGSFCANVASLPLDDHSTFIYSGRGGPHLAADAQPSFGFGPGLQTDIRPMRRDLLFCSSFQAPG